MADRPETSTVRTALAISEAFEGLLRPGREGKPVEPDDLAEVFTTVLRAARDLRAHQVDDLAGHLSALANAEPVPELSVVVRHDETTCAECRRDMTDDTAHFCASCWNAAKQRAAFAPNSEHGIWMGDVQADDDDVDPEEARRKADAAAARVRGSDQLGES